MLSNVKFLKSNDLKKTDEFLLIKLIPINKIKIMLRHNNNSI